ncbi:hypothetical protein P0F23_003012 [Vibrio metschnikovii]|nr:hypothetical protein [Vibrio metschnikovii]
MTKDSDTQHLHSRNTGAPLLLGEDEVIGIANHFAGESATFTHVGHYLPLLIERIDAVVVPAFVNEYLEVKVELETGLTWDQLQLEPLSTTFMVQNLTNEEQTLNPFIRGQGRENIAMTGCEQVTLKSGQYCPITVVVRENINVNLFLGNNRNNSIPIALSIKEIVVESGDDDIWDTDEEENAGSVGILALLLGIALRGLRRNH